MEQKEAADKNIPLDNKEENIKDSNSASSSSSSSSSTRLITESGNNEEDNEKDAENKDDDEKDKESEKVDERKNEEESEKEKEIDEKNEDDVEKEKENEKVDEKNEEDKEKEDLDRGNDKGEDENEKETEKMETENDIEDSSTIVAAGHETEEKISEIEVRSPEDGEKGSPDKEDLESNRDSNISPKTLTSDLKDAESESKIEDSVPSEPQNENPEAEICPKVSTAEENEKEEEFTNLKGEANVEKPISDAKETILESLEAPEISVGKITEENEEKQAPESQEKSIADCEDSSSSITEFSNENTAKVRSEESENAKKVDPVITESNLLVMEPENTEFVQISQEDKHDESQIENQSIDNAEDPFGGDNLNSENLDENMETDDLSGDIPDFQKLGDQADNLQDVVKAKDNNFQSDKTIEEKDRTEEVSKSNDNAKESSQKDSETVETDSPESRIHENKKTDEKISEIETTERKIEEGDTEIEKDCKKNDKILSKDGSQPLETTPDVLPGQDDELCIIPDSMKVILPGEEAIIHKSKEIVDKTLEKKVSGEEDKAVIDDKELQTKDSLDSDKICAEETTEGILVAAKEVMKDKEEETIGEEKKTTTTVSKKGGKTESIKAAAKILAKKPCNIVIDIDDESKNSEIEEIEKKEKCKQCGETKSCKIKVKVGSECFNVCSKECRNTFKTVNNKATDIPSDGVNSKREKRCAGCLLIVDAGDERNLSWETMEFCNEECLGKFQTKYGSYCRNCNGSVQAVSLGKYCVRFGYDVRQFCCSSCLEEFKKGLKVCSYCQKDISSGIEGFLAPVGDKGQFKDFCTQDCMEKYSRMSSSEPPTPEKKSCSVCQEEKIVHCEVQINGGGPVAICSDPCFAAFKFVNKVDPDQCSTCKKFFQLLSKKNFVVFYEGEAHMFCNKTCLNVFIITNRKIVPCNWCKVKKYNFDMIKKELKSGQIMMMCSLNCLTLYQVSINAVSARRINCDFCKEYSQAQYHLTMSDATIRNFCSYKCVMNFQSQYTKSPITIPSGDDPVPTGNPKRSIVQYRGPGAQNVQKSQSDNLQGKSLPIISSVTSLAAIGNGQNCSQGSQQQQNTVNNLSSGVSVQGQQSLPTSQVIYKQQTIVRPPSPLKVHNKMTQCKPLMHTKGVSVRPHPCTKATQTEDTQQIVIPIPVPIYVPYPMHMYSMPFPVPFPIPLPIPVPIFIPTTRNSAKGIFKDIKRIQEKIPADPFEAELLMMAEMVATDKKTNETDSDSDDDNRDPIADVTPNTNNEGFSPEGVDSSNTFGDDMLQMALKMATGELDEPPVDLETELTPNTITVTQAPPQQESAIDSDVQPERLVPSTRGRKRMVPYKPRSTPSKRGRRVASSNDLPLMPPPEPQPPPQPRIMEPIEKPDANMALKYTFGVNAWRQWVIGKNSELEKQSTTTRRVKLFKTELLQLTADELNYSLCLFVKEVRKPNGAEYAPDTIYYLCLGIQQYLFENHRIDNIFTDSYYEKFTDCLNDVAKKFSVLYNDAQYIVTRVEEEHLWESKQLGAHSPHVLLSTLMFFNTKHFNLVTVDEHMQLSFSHIMKHWKRNPAAQPAAVAGKVPGSRNVLLRFYPPQSALEANSRKKKVYEQQENEDNPLRCPVKLYEFYLSKCPESVKTRNDVFYLLPERSCVPDSPVWYSTSPLAKEHLIKMLYRVKMVKEINVALLTS